MPSFKWKIVIFIKIKWTYVFYNLSSNLKSFYLELKSPYTTDDKYLAVINNNGLWIKDVVENKTLIINASKINQNFIVDAYISEFAENFEIIRNIKSKKIDIKKNGLFMMQKYLHKILDKKVI